MRVCIVGCGAVGSLFAAFIVFVFLRRFRPTLISAVAIPSSLIATFAAMKYMTDHGIASERLRLSEDGALELRQVKSLVRAVRAGVGVLDAGDEDARARERLLELRDERDRAAGPLIDQKLRGGLGLAGEFAQ